MAPPQLLQTEEQTASYKDAFSLFDKDSSGSISSSELTSVMVALGRQPTPAHIAEIIREIDADRDGAISFDEFVQLMARPSLGGSLSSGGGVGGAGEGGGGGGGSTLQPLEVGEDAELKAAFKVFDKDGSGKISIGELKGVMDSLGEKLTSDELDAMIKEADLDGDNEISFPEFRKVTR